jgi:lipopolysaccharide/colanic/teichoic acid biosynthesis glycosyltransferase
VQVMPGITCTWQIGGRSQIPFPQQVELDLSYIRTRTLLNDFIILLRTPVAVLAARGAC